MAAPRPEEITDLATLQVAYRRALFTVLGHSVFFVVCCVFAIILRRMMNLPPALLSVAFVVALVLFAGDFWRFLAYRRRLRQLRDELS
jgi:hypothetical protein